MKETYNFLQTYEICFKLIYLKLLQEYFNNEIVGFTDNLREEETAYYTVTDIQGSITEVYNGSSNLVWKSGYTAFGEIAGEVVDLIDFDGMYTGCDYDAETGLTYHWNRWRSEDGSAFISEAPVRDGANWYGDAWQNPMVYVDRIGLFYYTGNVQQSSNNTNQAGTESAEKKNSEAPNVMGSTGAQTPPPVPNIEADGGNKVSKRKKEIIEQLKYLKEITDKEYTTPQERANAAKILRDEIRNKKKYNIDALFGLDEPFMNIDLRDFLNTSDTGLDYVYSDMKAKDGREAIFNVTKIGNKRIYTLVKGGSIEAEMDKGTYNYAKKTNRCYWDWTSLSEHGRWDMDTYFRQWNYTPDYRILLGHDFSSPGYNSHYEYMYKVE